jgi:hypothetical protein
MRGIISRTLGKKEKKNTKTNKYKIGFGSSRVLFYGIEI